MAIVVRQAPVRLKTVSVLSQLDGAVVMARTSFHGNEAQATDRAVLFDQAEKSFGVAALSALLQKKSFAGLGGKLVQGISVIQAQSRIGGNSL